MRRWSEPQQGLWLGLWPLAGPLAFGCSLLLAASLLTLPLRVLKVSSFWSDLESSPSQQSVTLELVWVCRAMGAVTGDPKISLVFLPPPWVKTDLSKRPS